MSRLRRIAGGIGALAVAALVTGCSLQDRQAAGPALVAAAGWSWQTVAAGEFTLAAALRPVRPDASRDAVLVVYLEGDGLAYRTPTQPAQDPTPVDPVALRLALAHPGAGPVAWLARPCQYAGTQAGGPCPSAYWTDARWAPEVVSGVGAALDRLKQQFGASRLLLVGYSGGGALAALLAERRTDIVALVTIAGNLDLERWVQDHDLAPLTRSLNPADGAAALATLPQIHLRGDRDTVVGEGVARAFLARLPRNAPARLLSIAGQDHGSSWAAAWPQLSCREEFQSLPGWGDGAACR